MLRPIALDIIVSAAHCFASQAASESDGRAGILRRATHRERDTVAIPSRAAARERFEEVRRATTRSPGPAQHQLRSMFACELDGPKCMIDPASVRPAEQSPEICSKHFGRRHHASWRRRMLQTSSASWTPASTVASAASDAAPIR